MAGKRILVVDDEGDIAEIICEILQGAGYQTMTTWNGKLALQMIQEGRPDAIVLDIRMPVMDGLEMLGQLKAHPQSTVIPIVVLTATQVPPETIAWAQGVGVTAWIGKPFEPQVLLDAVNQALQTGG